MYIHTHLKLTPSTQHNKTKTKHTQKTGEVTLRFRRAPQAGGSDANARLPRVPSIYGLDFAGGGQRRGQTPPPLPPQQPLPLEPDQRQGFVLKWHLCGRGELKRGGGVGGGGLRLDAAALVSLSDDEDEEEEEEEEEGGGEERPAASATASPSRRRQEGGGRRLRVAILVGCAGRALGAWAVVLTDAGLAAEPLAEWEGGWAVGALDWLEAYPLPASGPGARAFAVCGADGGGRLWRWVAMEGGDGQQQQQQPWRVAGGRLEGAALPAGAAAHLRALRGAPGKKSRKNQSPLYLCAKPTNKYLSITMIHRRAPRRAA
jgi:hypothetical protein